MFYVGIKLNLAKCQGIAKCMRTIMSN